MRVLAEDTPAFTILNREGSPCSGENKIRVGVFGHPEDQREMLAISEELLRISDCTVYLQRFDSKPEPEEVLLWLRDFSLLVFTVSESFLKEENLARCILLPYAVKDKARVLPIKAAESGNISHVFSSVCGHLHLLDRSSENYETELKYYYDEQVDPYHLGGLSAEEERIRQNLFVGKAFISYRKKDIAALYRFLDFLRNIPALRDLAVFYDSSLIPGEDFNVRLQHEIDSAEIIFFLVTPHILENGNYVIREEYPQAVEENKLLIPVVMEDTDLSELEREFPAFEYAWDFRKPEALTEILLKLRYGLGEVSEMSPEKKYFLALAYENGEGTEQNYPLSNRLFREASKEGSLPAKSKMTLQLLEGYVTEAYEGETEELLKDAMYSFANALPRIPEGFEKTSCRRSLARFAEEYYQRLWSKNEYRHEELLDSIRAIRTATLSPDHVRTVPFRYYAMPDVRSAGLYLREGNLELADLFLAKAREYLFDLADESGQDPSVMREVLNYYMYKGDLLVSLLLRGDESSAETIVETAGLLENGLNLALSLTGWSSYAEVITKDEIFAARMLQKIGLREGLDQVIDHLNSKLYRLGVFDEPFSEKALDKMFAENDILHLDLSYQTMEEWKEKLDQNTDWYVLDAPEETLREMFTFPGPFLPEGDYGDVIGNYSACSYRCPSCERRLYRIVFPEGRDPRLHLGGYKQYGIEPARVFGCPRCGRFYATVKGRKLIEGPVFSAALLLNDKNKAGKTLFEHWWNYFNQIGDLRATRNE